MAFNFISSVAIIIINKAVFQVRFFFPIRVSLPFFITHAFTVRVHIILHRRRTASNIAHY